MDRLSFFLLVLLPYRKHENTRTSRKYEHVLCAHENIHLFFYFTTSSTIKKSKLLNFDTFQADNTRLCDSRLANIRFYAVKINV